ncbi:hypothetical protein FA13DRAFT_87125 [Coprinellus micaceus]|uniref:Uncharacterized protein n=1 Tax=Coprinellus micaceus TaxID=71717 RepID=A0A4Y7SJ72_COPMI|nr:hypothetical protein FA13DRAFT_87125 [Coprinellus micaceus]
MIAVSFNPNPNRPQTVGSLALHASPRRTARSRFTSTPSPRLYFSIRASMSVEVRNNQSTNELTVNKRLSTPVPSLITLHQQQSQT